MLTSRLALCCLTALLLATPAVAADSMDQMQQAQAKMDKAMQAGAERGDTPDERFVRMMIPHHQGAIDMSRIGLEEIKDSELRRMVAKTIKENENGIEEMNAWLKKHGKL